MSDWIGSTISAVGNYLGIKSTNKANAAQANINREFEKEMSDTAHQREVEDLKAAGLNPILSAGGSGASTATGSTATMENPLSALEAYNLMLQNKKIKSEIKVNDSAELKNNAEGMYNVQLAKGQAYENIKNLPMTEIAKKYPKLYLSAQVLGNAMEKAGNLSGFIKPKMTTNKFTTINKG